MLLVFLLHNKNIGLFLITYEIDAIYLLSYKYLPMEIKNNMPEVFTLKKQWNLKHIKNNNSKMCVMFNHKK